MSKKPPAQPRHRLAAQTPRRDPVAVTEGIDGFVRATQMGFDGTRRRPGAVFALRPGTPFASAWMERVTGPTPAPAVETVPAVVPQDETTTQAHDGTTSSDRDVLNDA